ncbi:MAG: SPFH domain-containing protein [Bacteroidales bacterium]|nr:SPFH domain-containing protein [Bacteroidales bacterium]MCM1147576.1 SPFH domain-containing protein [Bacteroidales bacterium]MCM1206366.1 SPFH domain-containing protein [Bacillota bacterium]MCM1509100.1 SPFH domain-containing protein [Clostridium sp.]
MENVTQSGEFEFKGGYVNGFLMIAIDIMLWCAVVYSVVQGIISADMDEPCALWFVSGVILFVVAVICSCGFSLLEPNEAKVMTFFGRYVGTFRRNGYYWLNPFMSVKNVSLRARNLNAEPIKVNDKAGNPVLIGLVVVWRLKDTYKAIFDIDTDVSVTGQTLNSASARMNKFERFVAIQSDSALREVAGMYAYDDEDGNGGGVTLRDGSAEINEVLTSKLNERLEMAGLEVMEARINYLAYAPEIAAVMLRRQQAAAIITAREKIVEGAVSMVKMALDKLSDEKIVELDDGKKADMVSNLLVVLCADEPAQPVVNTGK